jgi:NADPH:quinone reductase-like Zn-dependent oxidoreductase
MRAVLVKDGKGPAENLYLGEAPTPKPRPGEVLVKVGVIGSNVLSTKPR